MTDTPARRLARAKRLYLRELRDGCNDCRKLPKGGTCMKCTKDLYAVILRPERCAGLQRLLVQMRLQT